MASYGELRIGSARKGEVRMVYKWSWEGQFSVPADVVGKHFEKLVEQYGAVTRENFLESARPVDSEVHDIFEWDEAKAAEAYRLYQASTIICNLNTEIESIDGETKTVRLYANVGTHKDARFVRLTTALKDDASRDVVLEDAKKYLRWFADKFSTLQELASIIDVIEEFLK